MVDFKEKFIERYSKITDFDKFIEYSLKPKRKAIRVNTIKTDVDEIKERMHGLKQVPWCNEGFWVKEGEIAVGNTLEHFLGYIYLQEASSMIPPLVLSPKDNDTVLDMCAAPGSKTTQIAAMMNNKGILVANDNGFIRLKPLTINLRRCGVTNCMVTLMEGRFFKEEMFDKVLVDAPCSGVGTIKKSLRSVYEWNPNSIKTFAGIQRQLIEAGFNSLREDGTLVYSTCTLEPEEDEGIIDYMINKYDNLKVEKINLNVKSSEPITHFENKEYSPEVKKCLRIWPQDNDTEGFFIAKIKKL